MASVASELSTVHHARLGLGVRGNTQAGSQQDSADSFGSLLDGTDPPPAAAPPAPSAPPTPTSPPPQQGAPDASADQPGQPPTAAGAAQTPPPPGNAATGVPDRPDDGKGAGVVKADLKGDLKGDLGPLGPVMGKAGKPIVAANFDAAPKSNGVNAVGAIVPASANASENTTGNAADASAGDAAGASPPNRHDDKSAASGQGPAVPGTDSTLNALVAPVPPPAPPAASAPSVAATAGDDDGTEISQLAAAGDTARPGRGSTQTAGTDTTPDAANGQNDSVSPDAADTKAPPSNSPIGRANAGGQQQSPPNAFANPAAELDAGRNIHPHGAARPAAEALPGPDHDRPASVTADPGQPSGATTAQNPDTSPATGSDSAPPASPPPANPAPDAAASPTTPNSLAAPASAATPAASGAPAAQTTAPAPATAPPAVPIAGLAVEIAARAQAGKNRFDIRLDPPDLGRIDVRLDVDHDGKVTSHVVVDRQETLDVLRRDAPQIERSLQDAGLKTSDNGLQFTLRDQSSGQNPYPRNAPLPGAARIVAPDADLPAVAAVKGRYGASLGLGSGIDIRV